MSIIFSLLLISCSGNSEDPIEVIFSKKGKYKLKSEEFTELPCDSLVFPYYFQMRGNYMLFADNGNYSMYLYNFKSGKVIPYAKRGRGPGEMVSGAQSIGWLNDSVVYGITDQTRQVFIYLVQDLLENKSDPYKVFRFPDIKLSNQLLLHDSILVGINRTEKVGLFGISRNGCTEFFSDYPNDNKDDIDPLIRHLAYQGNFISDPVNEIFVFTSRYAAIIVISKLINNSLEQTFFKVYWFPEYSPSISGNSLRAIPDIQKSRYGFLSSTIGNQHIYLLYSGMKRANTEKSEFPGSCSNLILVYDFSGNPVKSYILDVPLCNIGVTVEEDMIIGFSNYPQNRIFKFRL